MGLVVFGVIFVGAGIVASIAHELAHVLGVWAVGGTVEEINFVQKYVIYAVPDDIGNLEWVINLCPQSIGLLVAIYWLPQHGAPTSWVGLIGVWSWVVFTVWGSREDIELARNQYVPEGN